MNQSETERKLADIKNWYIKHWPLCVFCNHKIREGGELAHLIRRSESRRLQAVKLNTGLAHHNCHDIFDNKPGETIFLPRFFEVMFIIYLLDEAYYNRIASIYNGPDFSNVTYPYPLEHHGQLITLMPCLPVLHVEEYPLSLQDQASPLLPEKLVLPSQS